MITLTLKAASDYLNCVAPDQNLTFHGVSIDTRTLKPGNIYIALIGEQFDGHSFIAEASRKGAAAVIVSKSGDYSIPQLVVSDTAQALGKLGAAWRSRFKLPIIGVTGSNGKTTLKNVISTILIAACNNDPSQVLATEGNLNNHIGLPLMLCRLNTQHRFAVLEMGMNHFHEIEYLTHLTQPTVAVINNAAEAHLEGVQTIAGVAKAKGEIFLGLAKDGTAILNREDTYYSYWLDLVKAHHVHLSFGLTPMADVTGTTSASHGARSTFMLHTPQGDKELQLSLLGKHNILNALAATASTLALGIDLETIKQGLERAKPAPGRLQEYLLPCGTRIIDDTYNANPFSLRAAVDTLASFTGKTILVLGDMKELGPDENNLHTSSGQYIQQAGIQHLFTFGKLTQFTAQAYGNNAQHFTDREALIASLKHHLKPDTVILIKGSRSMRMEKILSSILPRGISCH